MSVTALELLSKDFVSVKSSAFVSELLGSLQKAGQTVAVVFDDEGNYLGLSSKQAVLRKHVDFSRLKVDSVLEKKPFVLADAVLQDIAQLMVGSDSKVLPVSSNGKLIGIVRAIDVVKQIKSIKELKSLAAKEIACLNPVLLPEEASFGTLISLMLENHVSKLPVVGKDGKLKGIVSFSDLVNPLLSGSQKSGGTSMADRGKSSHDTGKKEGGWSQLPALNWVVVENVKIVSPKDSVSKVIDVLSLNNISSVVVSDKNKLVGIITLWDLLESFVRLKKERKNIQFVNLPELDEIDLQFLNNSVTNCYDKLKHVLKQVNYLAVHFKFLEHDGLRKKSLVKLRVSAPGKLFVSSADSWILLDALHEAIQKLEREVIDSSKKGKT